MTLYRTAPSHALYQGDILVVPVALVDDNPTVITDDGRALNCEACKAVVKPSTQKSSTLAERHRANRNLKKNNLALKAVGFNDAGVASARVEMRSVAAVIMSHSCDVDQKDYVEFALVRPLAGSLLSEAEKIRQRVGNLTYFHLPPSPLMSEAVIDLGQRFTLHFGHLGHREPYRSKDGDDQALVPFVEAVESRVASLDEKALILLYKADLRRRIRPGDKPGDFDFDLAASTSVFEDDPARPGPDKRKPKGWWWPRPPWIEAPAAAATGS